jgi:hypothetical protein
MRLLHVANGTSTTMTIEAAGIPGVCSIWADPLYEGPVPGGLGDAELLEVRARYLSGGDPGEPVDVVNDLRQWRAAIDAHTTYDELVLWYEHDLFDQLNLLQLLGHIRGSVPRTMPVSLICIGEFPGHPSFRGLGELSAGELAPLLGTRIPVDDRHHAVAAAAWSAFRSQSPNAIERVLDTDTSAMPFLARALRRLLEEYPWTTDGLSRSERRLLQLAADGPVSIARLLPRMHEVEDAYYITDLSLEGLVTTLSTLSPPLLLGGSADPRAFARDRPGPPYGVAITEAGREALDRRRDRAASGLDRWIGGVHLHGGEPLWRWDPGTQRLVRA